MDRASLEALDRDRLIASAEEAGVTRARVLTRPELIDELLLRQPGRTTEEVRRSRGFLGRARDLLARVVERGLHLPDAADRIRSAPSPSAALRGSGAALPTVTLAEIYATQGHRTRAVETLERVLTTEPEHVAARALLSKLQVGELAAVAPALPPEPEETMTSSHMEESPSEQPAESAWMLDSEPLPTRYDVDECIAISVDPTTLYVYWELKGDTLGHLAARMPGGSTTLRVLVMVPTWDGPRAFQRDIDVSSHLGDWFVRELPEGAVVRAAVGWKSAEGVFVSAAHSGGVEPSRRERSEVVAQWFARWTPEASHNVAPGEPESLKLSRALARIEARRIANADAGVDAFGRPLRAPAPKLGSSEVAGAPFTAPTSGLWS